MSEDSSTWQPALITVIGSLNTDLITRALRIPSAGETLTSESFSTGAGGKGANQAVACARLSCCKDAVSREDTKVKMIGAVGDDIFGRDLISGLESNGIDVSGVQVKTGEKTGIAVIIVEEKTGENRILLSPNANYSLKPEQFDSPPPIKPDLIVLQLEIPLKAVLQILKVAKENKIDILLNPAPAVELPKEAYSAITHLVLNETEASMLSGISLDLDTELDPSLDPNSDATKDSALSNTPSAYSYAPSQLQRITDFFQDLGVKVVIITLGARGVHYAYYSSSIRSTGSFAGMKVDVVDTTAAGDTFVGAYAVKVASKSDLSPFNENKNTADYLHDAVKWANFVAAKTVERKGAQSAIPWRDEVLTLYELEAKKEPK